MSEPLSISVPVTECSDVEVCLIATVFNVTTDGYFAGLDRSSKLRALEYVTNMIRSRAEEPTNDQAS